MSDMSLVGTGHINGGPGWPCQIQTETERISVPTNLPKTDPNWSYVDALGHYHAYNQEDGPGRDHYPTLRTRIEVVPCGDPSHELDCNGANITHWHCVICDEEVKPGRIPGPHYDWIDGLTSWTAKVQVPVERYGALVNARPEVSLRFAGSEREAFGIAIVTGNLSMSSGDTHVTLTLVGTGALGWRKAGADG